MRSRFAADRIAAPLTRRRGGSAPRAIKAASRRLRRPVLAVLASLRAAPRGALTALPRPRREASRRKPCFRREAIKGAEMLIDFSGSCEAPRTVAVEAITGTMGLYDLAVWQQDRWWHWAVLM